jgi:hypothetical protein
MFWNKWFLIMMLVGDLWLNISETYKTKVTGKIGKSETVPFDDSRNGYIMKWAGELPKILHMKIIPHLLTEL